MFIVQGGTLTSRIGPDIQKALTRCFLNVRVLNLIVISKYSDY